jgi:hypothetical protein
MPELPLGFANKQESGLEELAGATVLAANVLIDTKGAVKRRPGIASFSQLVNASGISAVHESYGGDLYAVAQGGPERFIYKVTPAGSTVLGGGVSPAGLTGTLRPTIAETEMLLVLAGGAKLQKVELATGLSDRLGGTPPTATHVIVNSSRLVVNDIAEFTSWVRFSGIAQGLETYAGFELWQEGLVVDGTSAGHVSAEAKADPMVCLAGNTNEVVAFGVDTTQVFSPDPTGVFAPVVALEYGCSAPYSILPVDSSFCWLDNLGRIIMSDGRSVTDLSEPIKATLDGIDTVSDCFAFRYIEGPYDVMVWVFPTDGRAFAFQKGAGWSEWLGWNEDTNNWGALPISAHFYSSLHARNYVGTATGYVGKLTSEASTDLGTRINAQVVTGFLGRGTDAKKHCQCVRFSLRRGESRTEEPVAFLSWRDDPGPWGQKIPVSLGLAGERTIVLEYRSLGVYRRRQWRFEFSGSEDITLIGANETFEVLEQ